MQARRRTVLEFCQAQSLQPHNLDNLLGYSYANWKTFSNVNGEENRKRNRNKDMTAKF
jgi:hypothetical protein